MTCMDARRHLVAAIKEVRAADTASRAANKIVTDAVRRLPPRYVETADAEQDRAAVRPLVERAQAASTRYLNAISEAVNARGAAALRCAKNKR